MNNRTAWGSACIVLLSFVMPVASVGQTFTTLVSFDGTNGTYPNIVSLVQGPDGNFYGTTLAGGTNTYGTVFKVTPAGKLTNLYNLDGLRGASPFAGLTFSADGNFYGTTEVGGLHHNGTIFRITPGGSFTSLHSFDAADGAQPTSALVQADNGSFYGTTSRDGAYGFGTIFAITPSGTLVTLHNFDNTDGAEPGSALSLTSSRNLIGTTEAGGANGLGTIFTVTPNGKLTTLHAFDAAEGTSWFAGLTLAPDGSYYGTTSGGAHGDGTVFKITSQGVLTILHNFAGTDGAGPAGTLIQATDGNFYGTTDQGGSNCGACGTVFRITPGGRLTTLHSFNSADGAYPLGGLSQGTDGNLYGTTYGGGVLGYGTVFCVSVGLSPFVKTVPTFGKAGANIVILGTNLTGATSVSFNGVPATFSVESQTEISINVPAGATTGRVQVTVPGGTLQSNMAFRVLP